MLNTNKESLLFKESPICSLAAEVIQNEQSVYFYLYKVNKETKECITLTACWVKNLIDAPDNFDVEGMKNGIPPVMPLEFCLNSDDLEPLNEKYIEIIWSKEGNIAGLYYKDELICVIPSWANPEKFCGYTKNCIGQSPVGWQLGNPEQNEIFKRMQDGKKFWNQNIALIWKEYQEKLLQDLNNTYGEQKAYYAIDGGKFPPRGLSVNQKDNVIYVCTIGMGVFSMPNAELYYNDYELYNKNEIIFAFKDNKLSDEEKNKIYMQISAICGAVWNNMLFLSHGHTIDFKFLDTPYAVLVNDSYYKESSGFSCQNEGVNLLWIIPIDESTLKYGQEVESNNKIINKVIRENIKY